MASVCSDPNIVSISVGTKTVIIRLSGGELYSFSHSDIKKSSITEGNDYSVSVNKTQSEGEEIGIGLVCCDVSPNGKFLAFCTLSKNLCVVDIKESKPQVVREYNLIRGASKVRFTPIKNNIIVADKSGDVYLFVLESDCNQGQLILGHLSLLLDVLITPDEKHIITCDRDEKIRISCYPNGYNIVSYCLGHTEFVSSLRLLPHNLKYLITTSGDGTIRFWEFKIGKEVAIFCTSNLFPFQEKADEQEEFEGNVAAITDAATTFIDCSTSLICAAVDNFKVCLVFKCSTDNERLKCSLIQNISLDNFHPWGLSLNSSVLWLVLSSNDTVTVQSKAINLKECKFEDNVPSPISKAVQVLNTLKLTADQKKNVVNLLFKRKFENVKAYLSKKEERFSVKEPLNKKLKA